ncbi:MAG: hypothetical protein ACI9MR_000523 [Myxococcota bacterium]
MHAGQPEAGDATLTGNIIHTRAPIRFVGDRDGLGCKAPGRMTADSRRLVKAAATLLNSAPLHAQQIRLEVLLDMGSTHARCEKRAAGRILATARRALVRYGVQQDRITTAVHTLGCH